MRSLKKHLLLIFLGLFGASLPMPARGESPPGFDKELAEIMKKQPRTTAELDRISKFLEKYETYLDKNPHIRADVGSHMLFGTGSPSPAKEQSASILDTTLNKQFKASGLKFEVDKDQDFQFLIPLERGRAQLVWVSSRKQTVVGNHQVRSIFSFAYRNEQPPSGEVMARLLVANGTFTSSSWRMGVSDKADGKKEYVLVFSARVSTALGPDELHAVARSVAEKADELEKSFSADDKK